MDFKSIYLQLHDPAALPPGRNLGTHWVGVCVNSKAGLDFLEKIKISCLCWHLNSESSSPQPSQYTGYPISGSLLIFANLEIYSHVSNDRCPKQHECSLHPNIQVLSDTV